MGIPASFEIAGFTDAYKRLGKHLSSGQIYVPSGVKLEGNRLVWHFNQGGSWVKPTPAMFHTFVQLWQHPDKIDGFAKKWGILEMDEHGRLTNAAVEVNNEGYGEPIETWCYFSRRAFSALSISANLAQGRPGAADDWAALSPLSERLNKNLQIRIPGYFSLNLLAENGLDCFAHSSIENQRMILSAELTLWLKFSGLGFAIISVPRSKGEFMVDFSGRLLAAIALQLALTASQTNTLFTCSGCSKPYIREGKKPRSGQFNFCPECGRTASTHKADQRRRERVQEARKLHADGLTVSDIAKRLNTKRVATVRRWIEKGK
jgi:transposase-like protein